MLSLGFETMLVVVGSQHTFSAETRVWTVQPFRASNIEAKKQRVYLIFTRQLHHPVRRFETYLRVFFFFFLVQGGRRKMTLPPELAFGKAGRPPFIPPDATVQ